MRTLALLVLLAAPGLAAPLPLFTTPSTGTVEHAKALLDAQDPEGALKDAESAVARGGDAEAYAARADAKFALGRSMDEVIEDYARAAMLDARYEEKYNGLVAQRESEKNRRGKSRREIAPGKPVDRLAMSLFAPAVGGLLLIALLVIVKGRENPFSCGRCKKEPPQDV